MQEESALDLYAKLWTRLNVINAMIKELEEERADVKAKQRAIANGLVNKRLEALDEMEAPRAV